MVEFVGGGPLDGEVLPVAGTAVAFEQWFVDEDGVARRGVYQIDRAATPAVMRWLGHVEDPPLDDPVQMFVKVPGVSEPVRVEYEREIAEWLNALGSTGQGSGPSASEWFANQVRSRVISAFAAFAAMLRNSEAKPSAAAEAGVLVRAQVARQARDEIIPGTYIALIADFASHLGGDARALRKRAVEYLRAHPTHAQPLRSPDLLTAMGHRRRWVRAVLTEAQPDVPN